MANIVITSSLKSITFKFNDVVAHSSIESFTEPKENFSFALIGNQITVSTKEKKHFEISKEAGNIVDSVDGVGQFEDIAAMFAEMQKLFKIDPKRVTVTPFDNATYDGLIGEINTHLAASELEYMEHQNFGVVVGIADTFFGSVAEYD